MQFIHIRSVFLGFASAIAVFSIYSFRSDSTPAPSPLRNMAVEVPAGGWTDLGGAIFSPSEGIYQVVYGDFGRGDEFTIVEVVGFD